MPGSPPFAAPAGDAAEPWAGTDPERHDAGLSDPDARDLEGRDPDTRDQEGRWRTLVEQSPIGIFETDLDGRCTFANPAFERLTGQSVREAMDRDWASVVTNEEGASPWELRIVHPDGSARWVSVRSVPRRAPDGGVSGYLGTVEDVTDRKRLEERLKHDATHDRLTGIGGRALLVEQLTAALARTRRGGPGVALLFIDLDGFKRVNDMLGHAAGDELLVQVAKRLRDAVRVGDVCVRLGGDEFVVCTEELDGQAHLQALHFAERLLDVLNAPYDVHGHELMVGASIGIATARGEDPVSIDQMLSNADVAAYRAKRMGRGRVEMFDDGLRHELAQARRIARAVGRLLDQPRLPLLCSPIVHLDPCVGEHAGGRRRRGVVGFDCAVDWEKGGLAAAPEAIAQVVEEAGMARALDVALVRTMLATIADWETRFPAGPVPGLCGTLTRTGAGSPVLPELVRDMLARSGVRPALVWLGIPEAAVAHDFAGASAVAVALDELGVGVALRDFGSAVSSLEQLRRLPAHTMTIAGPLVAAVAGRAPLPGDASAALLAAIVNYGCALGRIVVAFGVQDEAHASRLRDLGCDFGSGPRFGGPLRCDDLDAFLARGL